MLSEGEMRALIGKRFKGHTGRTWLVTATNESGSIEVVSEGEKRQLLHGGRMLDYIVGSIKGELLEPVEPEEINYLPRTVGLMWLDVESGSETMTMKGRFVQ